MFYKVTAVELFILSFVSSIVLAEQLGEYGFNWSIFLYGIVIGFFISIFLYAVGEIIKQLKILNSNISEIIEKTSTF